MELVWDFNQVFEADHSSRTLLDRSNNGVVSSYNTRSMDYEWFLLCSDILCSLVVGRSLNRG
jgi:hypothetical protein